jgi:hypothetical protein
MSLLEGTVHTYAAPAQSTDPRADTGIRRLEPYIPYLE